VVSEILDENRGAKYVLDPFSGSGTTGLVCGEQGLSCDLLDINPFLIWLADVKTANYTEKECAEAQEAAEAIVALLGNNRGDNEVWVPPIKNIERWWPSEILITLGQIYREVNVLFPERTSVQDLLLIAFCRVVIEWSNAAFNHQSMSFKDAVPTLFSYSGQDRDNLLLNFLNSLRKMIDAAKRFIPGRVRASLADARKITKPESSLYDCVITSPPYPNRMSYIRELRPYMYWLGYLKEAREAGEMDWQAIGGTWGIATSRVDKWQPSGSNISYKRFYEIIGDIGKESRVLANYVHKYFVDIGTHLESVYRVIVQGGKVFYIVGNSKFYDTLVPVEEVYASLLNQSGFEQVNIKTLRKRNSKKELVESVVSAVKP